MRLFTGIDLPAALRARLEAFLAGLRPCARLQWSRPENLHITTRFIGEWPEDRLSEIVGALRTLPAREPFSVRVRGFGWFPNERAPRVFWAGIEAPPALAVLARDTDRALVSAGLEPEGRSFSPHLTLARIKDPASVDGLRPALARIETPEFGEFPVDRCCLFLSERGPSGAVYTKLDEFPFHMT